MFNFFVNKDSYNTVTHILSSTVTTLTLIIVTLNVVSLFSFIINSPLNIPFGKGGKLLLSICSFIFGYLLLFKLFKCSKTGDADFLFDITKKETNLVWISCVGNFVLLIILSFIRMYYFKK